MTYNVFGGTLNLAQLNSTVLPCIGLPLNTSLCRSTGISNSLATSTFKSRTLVCSVTFKKSENIYAVNSTCKQLALTLQNIIHLYKVVYKLILPKQTQQIINKWVKKLNKMMIWHDMTILMCAQKLTDASLICRTEPKTKTKKNEKN